MQIRIFDRRALVASVLALSVMVAAFIGGYAWLQLRMLQLHDREIFGGLQRELTIRDQFDRTAGRDELIRSVSFPAEFSLSSGNAVPGSRYRALFTGSGESIVGRLGEIPDGRRFIEKPGSQIRFEGPGNTDIYVASIGLADGAVLVVKQQDNSRSEIARAIGRSAAFGVLVVIFVGILTIYALNLFVLEHVRSLGETARKIMLGQMTARAPSRERLDALGTLTFTFNEMLDQNEALVSGMRTVTESLAHDLRTPLMRIRRAIAAAREADSAASRDILLHDAEAEVGRALQTFNSLVDLARAEAGLSRESMETLDLGSLAADMAELFEPIAEERNQRIECNIEPVTLVGHRQILKQAVGNLIENAIKYSPAGTSLKVLVHASGEGGGPEIIVQDHGPGIPVNAREQAVRPFVRLENPSRQPGSGMGLAIAAAVARLHRGKLILENAEPGLRVRLLFGHLEPV